ncbi:Uncharacterised protein [Hafnia alvei]|uniref:Uncharacterized protein n=1 Tax=Hafnia alvei TaxID=569 RepID=A0A377PEC3_HAFAL|nr:Uncharacterised protein [Hafnia alvei]
MDTPCFQGVSSVYAAKLGDFCLNGLLVAIDRNFKQPIYQAGGKQRIDRWDPPLGNQPYNTPDNTGDNSSPTNNRRLAVIRQFPRRASLIQKYGDENAG